jgi:hypothetical protein
LRKASVYLAQASQSPKPKKHLLKPQELIENGQELQKSCINPTELGEKEGDWTRIVKEGDPKSTTKCPFRKTLLDAKIIGRSSRQHKTQMMHKKGVR